MTVGGHTSHGVESVTDQGSNLNRPGRGYDTSRVGEPCEERLVLDVPARDVQQKSPTRLVNLLKHPADPLRHGVTPLRSKP